MPSFTRQVINALLPRGSAWVPKRDGGLDRLLEGIADCFATLKAAAGNLADLRNPMATQQLDDLEREFGVVTELSIVERSRRIYLHGIVYGDTGTGSDDNLEARLEAAGFVGIRVHQNDPAVDPAEWLMSAPLAVCGNADAVCGYEEARCGFGGGYMLINGGNPADTEYDIPADSKYWPFVFFVGGERSGWEFFIDWNMEYQHTGAWTPGGGASLSKSQTVYYPGGIRSLTIKAMAAETTEQQGQVDNDDADLLSFYRMHTDGGLCANEARKNLLNDGNMERSGTAAWTATTATLSKQGSAYSGSRCLRVVGDPGEQGWAGQPVLMAGHTYRIRGKARSHDGSAAPAIRWGIHRVLTHSDVVPRTTTLYLACPAGAGNAVTVHWGDGATTALVCDGTLKTLTHDYVAGTYQIGVSGDWDELAQWRSYSQAWLSGDLSAFSAMVDLTILYLYGIGCTGDLANLAGMALIYLHLYGTGCTGDIANLAGMPLTYLYLSNTGCTGDIANLAGMAFTVLYLRNTGCTYPVGGMAQPLAWRTADIQCYSCAWTTAMVDQMLLDHDAIAGAGYSSNLSIAGTNAAHTNPGPAEVARASLVAKGKMVSVN